MENQNKLGSLRLTLFGIGLILASGAFAIPGDFASAGAYPLASLLGWIVAGIGMFSLCMCYLRLGAARPDLTSGLYTYAKEGFGDYIGFSTAWGYWISAILAQVTFLNMLFGTLGQIIPAFGDGANLTSVICQSVIIWVLAFLITKGVNQAVSINAVVVAAKLMPVMALLVAIVFAKAFDPAVFMQNFAGEGSGMGILEQVKSTTFITVWIFVGVEGVVVISARAKTTKIAGRAAAISFLCMLAIYMMISILSMGVLPTEELAQLPTPSVAGVLEAVVGPWGATLVNVAVIVSICGALFTYTILCVESASAPAMEGCFPTLFTKLNKHDAPINSTIISTLVIQTFVIVLIFNEATYQVCYSLSTSMIMIPYFISALYALKSCCKGELLRASDSTGGKMMIWIFAIIASIYGFWMLYSTGAAAILTCSVLYGPGILLYIKAQKDHGRKLLPKAIDVVAMAVVMASFVVSLVLMATGKVSMF